MRKIKKSDVTYGQLEATLKALGFDKSEETNALGAPLLRFLNTQEGAITLLRSGGPEERLNAADLLSAEATVEGQGIASRQVFRRMLREAAASSAQAA